MTPTKLALAAVLALSALYTAPTDDAASTQARARLARLDFLAGAWSGEMWGGTFSATYSTPEGGAVLSHSRLRHGDSVSFYEFEVFEVRGDDVHLQPYPKGEPAGGFTLVELDGDARSATFENPDKDWPTRIVYHRTGEDALVITLSDPHGGSDKVERFELAR